MRATRKGQESQRVQLLRYFLPYRVLIGALFLAQIQSGLAVPQREQVVDLRPLLPTAPSPEEKQIAVDVTILEGALRIGGKHPSLPLHLHIDSAEVSGPRNKKVLDLQVRIRNSGQTSFYLPIATNLDRRAVLTGVGGRDLSFSLIVSVPGTNQTYRQSIILTIGSESLKNSVVELNPGESALVLLQRPLSLDRRISEVDLKVSLKSSRYLDRAATPSVSEFSEELLSDNVIRKRID